MTKNDGENRLGSEVASISAKHHVVPEKRQKVSVVLYSDAVVHPDTVVVESSHASIADAAVFGTRGFLKLARGAA